MADDQTSPAASRKRDAAKTQAKVGVAQLPEADPADTQDAVSAEHVPETPLPASVGPRLQALFDVAEQYGQRSFQNYAQIRSVAENLRDGFCRYLNSDGPCVYLVPPKGPFSARNYQSGAFSVAGQGYLPLTPISFGFAVLVSQDRDFVRIIITCRKEGDELFIRLERGNEMAVDLPMTDETFEPIFDAIYQYLVDYFQHQIDDYDNGRYGVQDIGFDLRRMTS